MSRWEPVHKSIDRQRQSDGCGRIMVVLVLVVIVLALFFGAWTWGSAPRCWACNHFRHEHRMCGWPTDQAMGTCICEKDK